MINISVKHISIFWALYIGIITAFAASCHKKPTKTSENVYSTLRADITEVTVADFRTFVHANNFTTTADSFGWSGYFNPAINNWEVLENANWLLQDGKNQKKDKYPVVHVSYRDACAYCHWKGGRLPTAQEWDQLAGDSVILGNIWQGLFPHIDEGKDGYKIQTAPVKSFPANKFGYYDMFGNVWEWTTTMHPKGERIIKGGSFLCDYNVCQGYIPSRYQTTADDSGLNHLGFRCVYDSANPQN